MARWNTHLLTAMLAIASGALSLPHPAKAMQAEPTLAAEGCIAYREDGQGGYRLFNACEYNVDVAFCAQPSNEPSLCLRTQSYTRETLKAKSEGVQKVWPEQALDLFACRTPGTVEILPSGMARCSQPPAQPAIPWLVSASLKNPGSVILNTDYPARNHDKEGTTRFELIVGPDGKPVSCTTTLSSGHQVLDQTACNAFVKRAKFSPAKDEAGNPTTGRYKGSVTWKAP
jgi:TonB family protein